MVYQHLASFLKINLPIKVNEAKITAVKAHEIKDFSNAMYQILVCQLAGKTAAKIKPIIKKE